MSNSSIDLTTLQELKEIMEDEFNELVTVYISDGKKQIESLQQAIESESAEDVRRIAHTLKGSSSNLGITGLAEQCKTLEHNAADAQLQNAVELLEKINIEYEVIKNTLEEML